MASGTRRSGPWVDHPSSRPRRRRLFPDCARDPPMRPMHKSACPLSCVCVCVCVRARVCMCVCVYVCMRRTEMRARRTTTHDPRPACSAMQRPSLGGEGGAGGLAQYPISSISRCMVWSGLVSPRGRRASRALCIPYEADRRTVIMRVTRLSGSGGLPRCAGGSEKGRADVRWSWMEEFHPHLPRHPGPQDDDIRPAQLMIALESRQGS